MSTLKATNLQNASSSTINAVLDANGNVACGGTVSSATGFLRNRIINPLMAIDIRNSGAAQTITAGAALAYTVDRFYAYCTGANVTGQRVQGAVANTFRYQFTGAAGVTGIGFAQRIEALNSADLAGKTTTFSVELANSLLTTVTWTAYYANTTDTFGTLASPTRTQIATGTFTVNSTVTRYSTQISVPAAATTGIEIVLSVGAQTSGTWTIGAMQFEEGSLMTSIERRHIGFETDLCQRYGEPGPYAIASGISPAAAAYGYWGFISFRTTKRAAPTITGSLSYFNASGGSVTGYTNGFQLSANTSSSGQSYTVLTNWLALCEL